MQIPICLPGNPEDEANQPDKEVIADIDPDEIQAMYPAYHWGTMIYLHGGLGLLSKKTVAEIKHNIALFYAWRAKQSSETTKILTFQ